MTLFLAPCYTSTSQYANFELVNNAPVYIFDTAKYLQFPQVCDYHDANYSVRILDSNGMVVDQTTEMTYNQDESGYVDVELTSGLRINVLYTAEIVVKTAVNSTMARFTFSE